MPDEATRTPTDTEMLDAFLDRKDFESQLAGDGRADDAVGRAEFERWMGELRAAAVEEASRYIEGLTARGLVSRDAVLVDLEVAQSRMRRGLRANGQTREPVRSILGVNTPQGT